jgi:hypothetical protein
MPLSQATITAGPTSIRDGADLLVAWASSAAAGTTFQVYIDRRLRWYGTKLSCRVQIPPDGAAHEVAVATCLPTEARADLSSSLPAPVGGTGNRAQINWSGGTYLGSRIVEFAIFRGATAGAAPNLSGAPLAIVAAYPQDVILDGFGLGPYGGGGFGRAASTYTYTSPALGSGTWQFAVVPLDDAGNPGTATTLAAVIVAPPKPPISRADGSRISITYSAATAKATLAWTPG